MFVAVFIAINCNAQGMWSEASNASFDLSLFNTYLQSGGLHIAERRCVGCSTDNKYIFYKRVTNTTTWNYTQGLLGAWASANNILLKDFNLYSSFADAQSGSNAWKYCNYDDTNVATFRDCGAPHETTAWLGAAVHCRKDRTHKF